MPTSHDTDHSSIFCSVEFDVVVMPERLHNSAVNLVLVSSVALSFISFWRAASIVLNDLASTCYYIGGISEQAIGKAAPWFILGVMLFSYAVRAVYVESCTMFTRGGVYKVVKEAMGGSLAKLSVSALMFDYILTGPISAVSAGQYLVGLVRKSSGARAVSSASECRCSSRSCEIPGDADRHRYHAIFLANQHHRHRRIEP